MGEVGNALHCAVMVFRVELSNTCKLSALYLSVPITLAMLSLFYSAGSVAATVKPGITLSTDSEAVYLGDSVIVDVEAVGIIDDLDISPLFKGADLLRETTGTRIAVIEGRVVEVKLRRMEFLPRSEGRVFFGPLDSDSIAGPVSSNTLVVNVLPPADTDWQPENDELQIALTLSTDNNTIPLARNSQSDSASGELETYIGQRIVAEITLKHQYPIADETLQLPDFDGFDILTEFVERRTLLKGEHEDEDDNWRQTAWRYHLFPRYSGTQTIGDIKWSGTVIRSRTQRADFERHISETSLLAKPATESTNWWLPASDVTLSEQWSTDVRNLSAGDEFIRTITLEARNVLSSQLPVIAPLESRAISSVLIGQERSQQIAGDYINAKAVFQFRMVAQSPIPVFLDTVRINWFDTLTLKPREAIIPARRINIGLPERADLLADLALHDTVMDRYLFELRRISEHFSFWHISLAVLSLVLLMMLIQLAVTERRYRLKPSSNRYSLPDL